MSDLAWLEEASRHPAATNIAPRQVDDYRESFEQRNALGFQNEYSEVVWQYRLYYKAFAETKPRLLAQKTQKGDR
jgi:hypothetical protein